MHLYDAHALFGEDIITFGAFELNRTKRALLKNGSPLAIGCRAMEILLALTEKSGAIVSNRELLRRVWPDTVVEEGTVRVHMALLRKVLRQADPDGDYVHNVTGRGYRFVAAVSRQGWSVKPVPTSRRPTLLDASLPQPSEKNDPPLLLTPVFGREQTIRSLAERLASDRFVTIAGLGGSGKTTVAVKLAESLAETHADGVCFIDLADARRSEELGNMLAAAVGASPLPADPLPSLLACLSTRSTLLVLDNCDHVVEAARELAECVLSQCPKVSILITSREPLRAAGEFVHELAPLELPATVEATTREDLMEFPAIRLFVERVRAYAGVELHDCELPLVTNVCRRLECNPLAIEIAAAQVRWLGMRSLSSGLNAAMYLSFEGRRTAARRHRTLRASFDWSYDLLSPDEQAVFRRLSIIAGSFNADVATAVIADQRLTHRIVLECLDSLVRKSLIDVDTMQEEVLYRLRELPRAYARDKLYQSRELLFRCFHSSITGPRTSGAARISSRFIRMSDGGGSLRDETPG